MAESLQRICSARIQAAIDDLMILLGTVTCFHPRQDLKVSGEESGGEPNEIYYLLLTIYYWPWSAISCLFSRVLCALCGKSKTVSIRGESRTV